MKSVELFAGAGGLGMGVGRAGFEHVAVVEVDKWACDTLNENTTWPLYRGDIREYNYSSLEDSIDLISGGPPCQPFSMGGRHRAFLDPRDMFPEAARAVRELRPQAFIFENVKGLEREAFSNYLEYVRLSLRHPEIAPNGDEKWLEHHQRLEDHETRGALDGLHYNVVVRLLNAADYGVPQHRERVFIVGIRSDLGVPWHYPDPTHSRDALLWAKWRGKSYWRRHELTGSGNLRDPREVALAKKLTSKPSALPWRTVRDALHDLPDPEFDPKGAKRFADHRFIPGARSYPGHTGSPMDKPAKTLKAGVHGVPGGENMLRRPDGSIRYFSERESARLQTFPDEFKFHGAWGETMRQLGNAVPVSLAEIVARSVRTQLEGAHATSDPLQSTRQTESGRERGSSTSEARAGTPAS